MAALKKTHTMSPQMMEMIINDHAKEKDGLLTNNDTSTLTTDDIDESEDENDHRDLFHTYHHANKNQITSYWRWWWNNCCCMKKNKKQMKQENQKYKTL